MNHHSGLLMALGRIRSLLVLMGLLLGLWIAFATLVVPPVIESAYRGESLAFLNKIIEGQRLHPVDYYLRAWPTVAWQITVPFVGFGLLGLLLVMVTSSPTYFRRYVGEATPGSLGAIRMLTCAILLVSTLIEDLPSIALLPLEIRNPAGLMGVFYALPIGFERLVTSETGLRLFQWLTEAILFLGLIGWQTRFVIPLGAVCHFLLGGILRDYSFSWHQGWVPLYFMAVLSFTPCGDGWSVDRLRKVYRGLAVPAGDQPLPIYGWARYACWVAIALPYVEAGLNKLRYGGLFWWNPTNMRGIFYYDSLTPREFDWAWSLYLAPAPDTLFALLGLIAVLGEFAFGMVLFSATARRILPVLMIMMHTGIFLLQRILFLDLMLLQFVFFDFREVRQKIGHRLALTRGRIEVLYDGLCPLCRRTVRLLACFDLFARLEFLDFRRLNLAAYNSNHNLNLTVSDLDQEMYVISRGVAYRGFYGYRTMSLALPAFWPLVPWLFLPGVPTVGEWVYGYVARNRLNLLQCDSDCASAPTEGSNSTIVRPSNDDHRSSLYALSVSAVTGVFLFCWFYHIEFYPLTSWAMYAGSDTSGSITYEKVFARYESGSYSPARLEDGIGALALDARYSPALGMCFGKPPDVDICKKFLTANGSAYNKKVFNGGRLTKYEIQRWTWDFRANPSDPNHGKLTDRFIFDITESPDAKDNERKGLVSSRSE